MFNKSLFSLLLLSITAFATFPCCASTKKLTNLEELSSSIVRTPANTVYVLLYKTVNNTEAIHTIFYKNRNKVLMFEKQGDASAFAQKLKKQNFPAPKVEAILESEVRAFCKTSNHDCELVRAGANLKPPTEDGRWEGVEKIFCDSKECKPVNNNPNRY